MNLCDGLFGRGGETRRGPPSYRLLEQGRKVQGVEKREGRGVGANVDSNPSGGEPSTERFISTRSPPLLAREHPPPPIPPPLHVLPEFQPGELNSAARRLAIFYVPIHLPSLSPPTLPPLPSPLFRPDPERFLLLHD